MQALLPLLLAQPRAQLPQQQVPAGAEAGQSAGAGQGGEQAEAVQAHPLRSALALLPQLQMTLLRLLPRLV
jgi:hypothetical protein